MKTQQQASGMFWKILSGARFAKVSVIAFVRSLRMMPSCPKNTFELRIYSNAEVNWHFS